MFPEKEKQTLFLIPGKKDFLDNIEISPVAVSRGLLSPAGTTSDSGDSLSTYNISDLYEFVKTYDKEFSPKAVNK